MTKHSFHQFFTDIALFARLDSFPVTALPLLTGALLADPLTSPSTLFKLAGIGLLAHVYGFVLNDIVDLDIDRKTPQRQHFPLVQERVSLHLALFVVVAMIPLAHATLASFPNSSLADHVLLGTSFCLVAVYDIFGKRFPLMPLIAELCFGVAIGLLALLGLHLATGCVQPSGVLISIFYVLQLLLTNSVHGGVKDLDSDLQNNVVTTPIWWGVRINNAGLVHSPLTFKLWGMTLQALSSVLILVLVLLDFQPSNRFLWSTVLAVNVLLSLWALVNVRQVLWTENLDLLRTCQYPHTMLSALMVFIVLLYFAPNWRTVAVIAAGFAWNRLVRRYLGISSPKLE